ncbi:MAG: alpha/beta fold hydrolase [Candidatus Reddybacter sp.]
MKRLRLLVCFVFITIISSVSFGADADHPKLQDIQKWVDQGTFTKVNGAKVFVVSAGKAKQKGHGVLIVHGFPGSSWDWSGVVPQIAEHTRVVIPDMIGFGRSDKPQKGTFEDHYSLFKQADLYEAIAKKEGLTEVMLVAHDMGQTVASELMKRHQEGTLSFKIKHAIIFDGSTLINLVNLLPMQINALAAPDTLGPDIPRDAIMKDLNDSFAYTYPAGERVLGIMADQILHNEGDRVFNRQIRYMIQRKENLQRWQAGIINFNGPVSMFWAEDDPVSVVKMAYAWKDMQPKIDLHIWPGVAHWPMIDVPDRVAKVILDRYSTTEY